MTKPCKTGAASAAGSAPSPFSCGSASRREDGTRLKKKRSPRRIFWQLLCHGACRESPGRRNLGGVFRSIPGNVTERAGDIRDSSRHCRCVSLVADYAISIALQHEAVCRVPTLYRRDPRRARIGARNSFLSIGIPTADLRFYPAAMLVPFQEKIGSGIGFAAARGRGLDEDDRCALGRIQVAGTGADKLSCHRL